MCKKYIIQIGEDESYPFDGQKQNCKVVVVRKNITFSGIQQETAIARKLQLLQSLSSPYFIRITRILQRKSKYYILDYQYVPQNLARCSKIGDQSFLFGIKDKLIQLCQVLSESCIKMDIKIQGVGVTQQGEPKVFINQLFEVVPESQKPSLKKQYQKQLQQILQPYFNFKASKKALSQLSDYSARLDKKIAAIQNKIHKRKYGKSRGSSKQSAKSIDQQNNKSKKSNIVLESMTSKLSKASQSSGKTTYSFIDPQKVEKPRTHKFSFNDYTTTSHKLNESTNREDSLTKRLSTALQKSKRTFKIYEKYFKHNNRL